MQRHGEILDLSSAALAKYWKKTEERQGKEKGTQQSDLVRSGTINFPLCEEMTDPGV